MIWAGGHGVYLNVQEVHVTTTRNSRNVSSVRDYGYRGERVNVSAVLSRSVQDKVAGLRAFSAGALTLATYCGRLDANFNYGFNAWDLGGRRLPGSGRGRQEHQLRAEKNTCARIAV